MFRVWSRRGRLMLLTPDRSLPRFQCRPPGHAEQPACQRTPFADRARFAGKDQKGGLKGVFRVVIVSQHSPADAEHQPAVPAHQQGKRPFVALAEEAHDHLAPRPRCLPQAGARDAIRR